MTLTQPDFMQLQDELRGFTTRKGAVDFLHTNFPNKSKNWLNRHLPRIYALSPDDFYRVFMHTDSTGEHTVNLVNSQRTAKVDDFTGQHVTTVRGALVKRHGKQYEGEIVSCTCGWERRWVVRNGSADVEGRLHENEMNR